MAGLLAAFEVSIGNYLFRNQALTGPGAFTVGLSVNGSSELASQYGYARTAVTMGAHGTATISNSAAITFPACSSTTWGTVSHMAAFTAAGVQMTDWQAVTTGKAIGVGDVAEFAIGAFTVTWTTGLAAAYAGDVLEYLFKATALPGNGQPATVYVGVSTDGATEITGNGYVRKACAFTDNTDGSFKNTSIITHATNTGSNWGHITHVAIFDAESTGAQMTAWTELPNHVDIAVGDTLKHAAEVITINID